MAKRTRTASKRRPRPKLWKVGVWRMGIHNVELWANRTKIGAQFVCAPDDGGRALIVVGLREEWPQVLSWLLHEVTEMAMAAMDLRYVRSGDYANDSGAFWFHMDHQQFSEATARVAYYMAKAVPALAAAYRKR